MSPQFAADVSLLLSATADPVVQEIFWMPTNWSEICAAVLHNLFSFTPSMRLRGKSWFLLRGPMQAIVPVQMDLGQEVL